MLPSWFDPDDPGAGQRAMLSPVTIIKGQAQLAARDAARCDALSGADRERLMARLAIIGSAADTLATCIDTLSQRHR